MWGDRRPTGRAIWTLRRVRDQNRTCTCLKHGWSVTLNCRIAVRIGFMKLLTPVAQLKRISYHVFWVEISSFSVCAFREFVSLETNVQLWVCTHLNKSTIPFLLLHPNGFPSLDDLLYSSGSKVAANIYTLVIFSWSFHPRWEILWPARAHHSSSDKRHQWSSHHPQAGDTKLGPRSRPFYWNGMCQQFCWGFKGSKVWPK